MNERITRLTLKASDPKTGWLDRKKFAELIIKECISACATNRLGKTVGAEDLIKQRFGVEE